MIYRSMLQRGTQKRMPMIENERCLLCSGCAIVHIKRNGNRIFIYTQSQLDETIEDMSQEFEIIIADK